MEENTKLKNDSWEKVLSDYVRHQRAYQEQMNKVKDLNPIVWSWSDAATIPSFNPTVDNTDSTELEREKKKASDQHKILQSIEKVAKNMVQNGNMVTADLLQRFAPPGTSPQALAMALGISESGRVPGEVSGELLMGRHAYMQHRGINKSWADGLQPLRKDAPMEAHADKFGKEGGMKMRWDAAHNYKGFNLVDGPLESLSREDQFAVKLATKLSGGKPQKVRGGKIKVFVWLRPGQEDFYQRELSAYKTKHSDSSGNLTPEATKHIQKVESERAQMVAGDIKTYRHTERYRPDKVQPGTIAAKNIKMGTVDSHGPKPDHDMDPEEAFENFVASDSKQLIPHQGQHGATAYRMWEGEADRMKVGRADVGRRKGENLAPIRRTEPEKVEGVSLSTLWAATATPEYGMQRRQAIHRDVIQPGGQMRPARSRPTSRRETTILPNVRDTQGAEHGSHFTEGAWRQLVDDAMAGKVKVVRGGRTQTVQLSSKEQGNLSEAAARIAVRDGAIQDTSEFSGMNAKGKKKFITEVVRELHKNRFSDRYGTASQRAQQRERLAARGTEKSMRDTDEYLKARLLSKSDIATTKMTRRQVLGKIAKIPKAGLAAAGAKMAIDAIGQAHKKVGEKIRDILPGAPRVKDLTAQQIASGTTGTAPGATRGSIKAVKIPSISNDGFMRSYAAGRKKMKKTDGGRPDPSGHIAGATTRPVMAVPGQSVVGPQIPPSPAQPPTTGAGAIAPSVMQSSPNAVRPKTAGAGKPDVFKAVLNNNLSSVRGTVESMPRGPEIINAPLQRIPEEDSNRSKGPSKNKSTNDPAFKKLVAAVSKAKDNFKQDTKGSLNPDRPVNTLPVSNRNKFTKQAPNPDINRRIAAELRLAERASQE